MANLLDIIKSEYDVNNYQAMQIAQCMDDEDKRELIAGWEEQVRRSFYND